MRRLNFFLNNKEWYARRGVPYTLGFLFYNFNPATIFMGDTGSLFLGFVISAMSIYGSRQQKSSTAVAVAIPLLALGLPLADTALAMFRRALRGRSMFSADREHIHHKLLDLGLTHRQAVLVARLDNLGKGASGAAVQNLRLMLGL